VLAEFSEDTELDNDVKHGEGGTVLYLFFKTMYPIGSTLGELISPVCEVCTLSDSPIRDIGFRAVYLIMCRYTLVLCLILNTFLS